MRSPAYSGVSNSSVVVLSGYVGVRGSGVAEVATGELRRDSLPEEPDGLELRWRRGSPQLMSVRMGTSAKAVATSSRTFFICSVLSGRMCLRIHATGC